MSRMDFSHFPHVSTCSQWELEQSFNINFSHMKHLFKNKLQTYLCCIGQNFILITELFTLV